MNFDSIRERQRVNGGEPFWRPLLHADDLPEAGVVAFWIGLALVFLPVANMVWFMHRARMTAGPGDYWFLLLVPVGGVVIALLAGWSQLRQGRSWKRALGVFLLDLVVLVPFVVLCTLLS